MAADGDGYAARLSCMTKAIRLGVCHLWNKSVCSRSSFRSEWNSPSRLGMHEFVQRARTFCQTFHTHAADHTLNKARMHVTLCFRL